MDWAYSMVKPASSARDPDWLILRNWVIGSRKDTKTKELAYSCKQMIKKLEVG